MPYLGSIAIEIIANLLLGWELFAVNASRLLGGILTCQNPYFVLHKPFKTDWGIVLKWKFSFIDLDVTLLNLYAPYNNK